MKFLKSFVTAMAAVAALGGFTACQDDFDNVVVAAPEAALKPNTTILELKEHFWVDGSENYATEIKAKEDGSHWIIAGRVITTDYPGNIYKNLVIQDETAAITISINAYSLYQKYRIGQEIVMDLTGLHIGKYMGLMQLGALGHSSSGAEQTTYMSEARFNQIAQLNGFPEPSKVIVHNLANMSEPSADIVRWQSELVLFNSITAVPQETNLNEEGIYKPLYTFGIYHENFDQKLLIDNTEYSLRTSGYSNFYYELLPTEPFDAKLLLSYYNGKWQLYLIDYADILTATIPSGTENNPWTIDEAIENINAGTAAYGWTSGYIVGTVAPEVETVSSDADIEWGTEATLANTVVIAPFADCKDWKSCLIVPLPQESVMRSKVALKDNPGNLGKQIAVQGTPEKYMGAYGITGNLGTAAEFKMDGLDLSGKGDGTEASPYNCAQVIAMNPQSKEEAVESNVWVHGFIVGVIDENYSALFGPTSTQKFNILISDVLNPTAKEQCVCVQLPAGDVRDKLNLADNPGNMGKEVQVKGNIVKYQGMPGVGKASAYILDGQGSGGGGSDTPGTAIYSASFASGEDGFTIYNVSMNPALSYVWSHDASYGYMKASAYKDGSSYASNSWLVSPLLDLSAATSPVLTFMHVINKFPDLATAKRQVALAISVDGGNWQTLDIPQWSTNANWTFVNSGNIDLSAYVGKKIKLGFNYTSEDGTSGSWEVKEIAISGGGTITASPDNSFPGGGNMGGGSGDDPTPPTPPTPSGDYKGDFDSFNGGEPKGSYGTYTNATGWTAENCNILSGVAQGATDANPRFAFIGGENTMAVTLLGNTDRIGKLTSPVIAGGMSKLTFNYGTAYTASKSKFSITITVKDTAGKTIAETVLSPEVMDKCVKYDYTWDVNVSGDFVIEIVNNCPSNSASNVDRFTIWNLTWE